MSRIWPIQPRTGELKAHSQSSRHERMQTSCFRSFPIVLVMGARIHWLHCLCRRLTSFSPCLFVMRAGHMTWPFNFFVFFTQLLLQIDLFQSSFVTNKKHVTSSNTSKAIRTTVLKHKIWGDFTLYVYTSSWISLTSSSILQFTWKTK